MLFFISYLFFCDSCVTINYQHIQNLCAKHFAKNMNDYMTRKLSASDHYVLMTKWIGGAWEKCTADSYTTICAFRNYGISLSIDGSEDECINIHGLEGYQVYTAETENTEQWIMFFHNKVYLHLLQKISENKYLFICWLKLSTSVKISNSLKISIWSSANFENKYVLIIGILRYHNSILPL